jgi:CMP-N-acetylneuraminic acid synthetase
MVWIHGVFLHSINIALECKYINDVYISTDSEEYKNIAIEHGANITPLRPIEISDDLSPDIDTFKFFIDMFENNNERKPDIIIHLRPTYPNRDINILNDTIEYFIKNMDNYDSLRTVVPIKKTPYKMYNINNNILIPFISNYKNFKEPYNQPRQQFPDTYLHNGCIDILKTSIIKYGLLSGKKILPYIMKEDEINDIDDINDFKLSEKNRN